MQILIFNKINLLRGAERIWPPRGARRSVAVPNGEGVASGSATRVLNETCSIKPKKEKSGFKKLLY